ncbi:hypothetical protein KBY97_11635 [Synechococcus sp. ATX 2A4]|uniref:hypothetical protein n=1 Tax=Synechococcus sp. ATX 2A4 TaxID=2823727 RepID=UPI0020CBBC87|nr:hypothetical protein [Synechococcus sp. ATX 2A4]MCP9885767.1 hypothetical protein [Synechococcus sp. ATX 2A4]
MALVVRLGLFGILAALGLAGLSQLRLHPPLASRADADTVEVLARLETQESLLGQRQQVSLLLNRFVGAEITRYFWGGFTPYLDVLGIEIPTTMKADVVFNQDRVQLVLAPIGGDEIYLARVEAIENAPRGVVCRGSRPAPDPEAFPSQGNRLLCPAGWATLPAVRPAAAAEATRS